MLIDIPKALSMTCLLTVYIMWWNIFEEILAESSCIPVFVQIKSLSNLKDADVNAFFRLAGL